MKNKIISFRPPVNDPEFTHPCIHMIDEHVAKLPLAP